MGQSRLQYSVQCTVYGAARINQESGNRAKREIIGKIGEIIRETRGIIGERKKEDTSMHALSPSTVCLNLHNAFLKLK